MGRVKLIATEGMVYTNGEIYGSVVYLGMGDSPDNWYQITEKEACHKMEQEARKDEENLY